MSGLAFYLYGFPLLLSALVFSLVLTVYRDGGLSETEKTGLYVLFNYSLANILLVLCWSSVTQWREGLLILSTLLAGSLSIAQAWFGLRLRHAGGVKWVPIVLLWSFLLLNVPITITAMLGALSTLPA